MDHGDHPPTSTRAPQGTRSGPGSGRGAAVTAVICAILAAASYGSADFTGAAAARRADAVVVTAAGQLVSFGCLAVGLVVYPPTAVGLGDLAWGAVAGLGAGAGLVLLYRALARGPMATAAALTALWSVALPVAAAVALGDRPGPLTRAGLVLAVPAGALVSLDGSRRAGPPPDPRHQAQGWRQRTATRTLALVAGLGFSLFYVALSRTSAQAGLAPLVGARVASLAGLGLLVARSGRSPAVPRRAWPLVALTGLLDGTANIAYLMAVHRGSLSWVAAVTSLYPAATVLLARVLLHERLARAQLIGLLSAAGAVVLVTVGTTA